NLIDQNTSAGRGGNLANSPQRLLIGKHAARIMKVGNDDEPGARTNLALEILQIDLEVIFRRPAEAFDLRAKILSEGEQRFVGRLLDQNFVAIFNRGSHGEVVGHRSATRNGYNLQRTYLAVRGQRINQGLIAVRVVAIQINVIDVSLQLRKRQIEDAAQCQIVLDLWPRLGPVHVSGLRVHEFCILANGW